MKRHYLIEVEKNGTKWEASVTIGYKYFVVEEDSEEEAVEAIKKEVYDQFFRDYITIDIGAEDENIKF